MVLRYESSIKRSESLNLIVFRYFNCTIIYSQWVKKASKLSTSKAVKKFDLVDVSWIGNYFKETVYWDKLRYYKLLSLIYLIKNDKIIDIFQCDDKHWKMHFS